jgi:2-C-methyl-D-erythritol 4-phosphate cytidylyltransferase
VSARAAALIVAAGSGERLGLGLPKAFVPVGGRAMIEWSAHAIRNAVGVEEVVVALPQGFYAPAGCVGVEGGATRSESVKAALATVSVDAGFVLVHDAARPLVTIELAERVLGEVERGGCDCAVAAAPVADTVKVVGPDRVVLETLDRTTLWGVQTPQAFRREALERALDVPEDVLAAATDDASLVERAGGIVRVVEAPRENFKITTQTDVLIAEKLFSERIAEARRKYR